MAISREVIKLVAVVVVHEVRVVAVVPQVPAVRAVDIQKQIVPNNIHRMVVVVEDLKPALLTGNFVHNNRTMAIVDVHEHQMKMVVHQVVFQQH